VSALDRMLLMDPHAGANIALTYANDKNTDGAGVPPPESQR